MDLASLSFAGVISLGVVNVLSFFKKDLTSAEKFGLSIIVAFGVGFIPAEMANEWLDRIKDALAVAFAASGTYKIASKAGGS